MATRIRYTKTETPDVYVSKQVFINETTGQQYLVQVNETTRSFEVLDATSKKILSEGKAINNHQARIKAKEALVQLGIVFQGEKRETKQEEVTHE